MILIAILKSFIPLGWLITIILGVMSVVYLLT